MFDRMTALNMIERSDPDGGERKPTEADYRAHRDWAIRNFGEDVWREYAKGGWGEQGEDPVHVEY